MGPWAQKLVKAYGGPIADAVHHHAHCRIGAAVARRIVSEGGKVAIADLDAEAGAALVSQLGEDRACFFHCDVK
jgi:NAD(P)-dependent dehydrogenase (short-subunit alcohol dehydrogenase family)